jgi:hypothetical protein
MNPYVPFLSNSFNRQRLLSKSLAKRSTRRRGAWAKTRNTKNFKRFGIPELDHLQRPLEDGRCDGNTRTTRASRHVLYTKPAEVVHAGGA